MTLEAFTGFKPEPKPRPIHFEIWETYKDHDIIFHPAQGFSVARPGLMVDVVATGLASPLEARAYVDRLSPPPTLGEIIRNRMNRYKAI